MQDKFIQKASIIFNYYFDYSHVEYINAKTKVKIICPEHGEFYQTPDKHLNSKYPCPTCNDLSRVQRHVVCSTPKLSKSIEDYLEKFYTKYDKEVYYVSDYDEYIGITKGNVTVYCSIHDSYKQSTPRNFLISKYPCKYCASESTNESMTKDYEDFLINANLVHGNKYLYPEDNRDTYVNRKSVVKVQCNIHGVFEKKAQNHLSGQGCLRCRLDHLVESGVLSGGYNEKYFEDNPSRRDIPATLYYAKIGSLYKNGITINLKQRIKSLKSKSGLDVKLLYTEQHTLYSSYIKEQKILNYFAENRVYTEWSTELFKHDILNKAV